MLKINEIFYSLKGEGLFTGTPMTFIRFSGCNLKCPFCDTPHETFKEMEIQDIIDRVALYPSDRIVITGGEPLHQDILDLIIRLKEEDYKIHLETNGTINSETLDLFDWVAVSPKGLFNAPVLRKANEIKVLVDQNDSTLLTQMRRIQDLVSPRTILYLMPIALSCKEGTKGSNDLIQGNINHTIEQVKRNPRWRLCIQAHKYLNIP